jgi:hypothetical protein
MTAAMQKLWDQTGLTDPIIVQDNDAITDKASFIASFAGNVSALKSGRPLSRTVTDYEGRTADFKGTQVASTWLPVHQGN